MLENSRNGAKLLEGGVYQYTYEYNYYHVPKRIEICMSGFNHKYTILINVN